MLLLLLLLLAFDSVATTDAFRQQSCLGTPAITRATRAVGTPTWIFRRWKATTILKPESQHRHCDGHFATSRSDVDDDGTDVSTLSLRRRDFLQHFTSLSTYIGASLITQSITAIPPSAHAMGLMQFPCLEPLHNSYHFLRSGTSLLEEQDIWSTNPLFLTNREAALSNSGRTQVLEAVQKLAENNIQPSQIRHSLAASAMDTAGIVRDELKVGQNRINPEFVFMDPRAVGAWEGMSLQSTQAAVAALDDREAGPEGREGRPPPNDDGTPNETLFDQSTRLRQLMSALETQYSGDTILLVFPDGTGPALLSAMISGIPLNQVHVLEYQPGELRMDVTRQSTLDLFKVKQQQAREVYMTSLQRGDEELEKLRSLDMTTMINKKDQLLEDEQMAIELEYHKKKDAQRRKEEEAEQARLARQQEIEMIRKERQEVAEEARLAKHPQVASKDAGVSTKSVDPNVVIGGIVAGVVIGGVSILGFIPNDADKAKRDVQNSRSTPRKLPEPETDDDSREPSLANLGEKDAVDGTNIPTEGDRATEKRPSLYERSPPPSPPTEEDRVEAARIAMEGYMNKDDGGDDWLQMMNQLMDDEDEEALLSETVVELQNLDTLQDDFSADLKGDGTTLESSPASWNGTMDDVGKWQ